MKVLILGRHTSIMKDVIESLAVEGFDAAGVFTDDDAVAAVESGDFQVFAIGGGVEAASRPALIEAAEYRGMNVLEIFGPGTLLPRLRELSKA
jgi:hypothetical protein